jgi:hypothetical protein
LKALFERSSEGAYAMAHALHTHYLRRGYRLNNKNVGFHRYRLNVSHINAAQPPVLSRTLLGANPPLQNATVSFRRDVRRVSEVMSSAGECSCSKSVNGT